MDAKLQEYARLVVEVGVNLQKGQKMVLRSPIQSAAFAQLCAAAAYEAGCAEVIMEYTDAMMTRMKYLYADEKIFDTCPLWETEKLNGNAAAGAAFLSIYADDPNMLQGVDPDRIRRNQQSRGKALKPYQDAMISNRARWCIVSVPIEPWAQKVFPDDPMAEAKLWDAIYSAMRVTGDGKSIERWQEHTIRTRERCRALNEMRLTSLRYTNNLGTDLTIGLPDNAVWLGGAEEDPAGIPFVANMPTEEIFTAPHRLRVEGRVVSAMPFVLNGNVIDQFALTFREGQVVAIEAQTPRERALLENAVAVDEGARYLGEVALVPHDSPISNMGILFYNTLFDENASCHLALGKAYPCVKGAEGMSEAELLHAGINESITHEDFMIGTSDLSIVGTSADGSTVQVFADGNFAF